MKRNKDQEKSSKKGDDKDTGHEKSITKETGNDDGNGEREHPFPHLLSLSLSDWKVICNTRSFQPSRKGDNWPVEAGR